MATFIADIYIVGEVPTHSSHVFATEDEACVWIDESKVPADSDSVYVIMEVIGTQKIVRGVGQL